MSLKDIVLDILFIGHSLVGPTMPGMLENAVSAMGGTGQVEAQIINGAPLGYNWEHGAGAEGVNARAVLPSGDFEVLVLTEGLPLAPVSGYWRTADFAYDYYQIAAASNPSTQVFIYETWHSILSGTGASIDDDPGQNIPWRTRIDDDLKVWQGFVDDVNGRLASGATPVRLIPAGQAMGLLSDRIQAGQVPGLSDISDVFSDDIHLNGLGNYLVTMVMYASIYGADPAPLPVRLGGQPAPSPALADALQSIAWDAVRQTPGTGLN